MQLLMGRGCRRPVGLDFQASLNKEEGRPYRPMTGLPGISSPWVLSPGPGAPKLL